MKKALLFALALVAVPPVVVEAQQDLDELVHQGDIYLKRGFIRRNNLTPYTGEVLDYAPGRCSRRDSLDDGGCRRWVVEPKSEVRARGYLRDGMWHGRYENFRSGNNGHYNMGQKCGPWRELGLPGGGSYSQQAQLCRTDLMCLYNLGRSRVLVDKRYPSC